MSAKTILTPLDGSENAETALPYAVALAQAEAARLALLAVVEREPGGMFGLPPDDARRVEAAQRATLRAYLGVTATNLLTQPAAATLVRLGRPAARILATADRLDATAIVMATHGHGGLARLVLGSVADKVMRGATRPVLLVGQRSDNVRLKHVTFRRLLVPLDGSTLAEGALAPAARLAQATGAGISLVRVEPWRVTTLAPGFEYAPGPDGVEETITEGALRYLDQARTLLPADLRVETTALRGGAAANLITYVEQNAIDLVVLTTHGRGGLKRLALGSVADRIVRAGAPTLLIRATKPAG